MRFDFPLENKITQNRIKAAGMQMKSHYRVATIGDVAAVSKLKRRNRWQRGELGQ